MRGHACSRDAAHTGLVGPARDESTQRHDRAAFVRGAKHQQQRRLENSRTRRRPVGSLGRRERHLTRPWS